MILLVNGDDWDGTATGSAGGSLLLLTSSESSNKRLVNENELLVFSRLEEVLDMDSGSCSDFDKLLLRLLLCDSDFINSSWSRLSISSESEFISDSSSLVEMLDVMDDDWEMLSASLSSIALSNNSRDEV